MPDGLNLPRIPFGGGKRYNSYGSFLRERFGCRVYKVVVDAGFTCPNRDGTLATGGCTYCSNDAFRPTSVRRLDTVQDQVSQGIEYLRRRYGTGKFIAYFQPFTNTHAPLDRLVALYESALQHPDVVGLAVGTRPDCIDEEKFAWFAALARSCFVTLELGLESMQDRTLTRINRGHNYACWREAVDRIRGRGVGICAHVILGFPWETREEMLAMAPAVSEAGIDFLKLHHLHVVRHTALGNEYLRERFRLLGYEEYLTLVVDFLERLGPSIKLQRLFGSAPGDQLLGPHWGKNKGQILREIELRLARRDTWQGKLWKPD